MNFRPGRLPYRVKRLLWRFWLVAVFCGTLALYALVKQRNSARVTDLGGGLAEIVVPGRVLGPDTAIYFGKNEAAFVRRTEKGVVCEVPPSDFAGIGWSVTVGISIGSTPTKLTWKYPAANPPTRVANIAVLWLRKGTEEALDIIQLFVNRLGPDWRYQFFITFDAAPYYAAAPLLQKLEREGRLEVVRQSRFSRRVYAFKNVDPGYWERIHGDRVLVFQTDSVPCSGADHEISDFFEYDYVGAPWKDSDFGGNGGLSLRNRTALIRLLRENRWAIMKDFSQWWWKREDVSIAKAARHSPYFRMAPVDVSKHFSVEWVYNPRPWGVHQAWYYVNNSRQYTQLLRDCPEMRKAMRARRARA